MGKERCSIDPVAAVQLSEPPSIVVEVPVVGHLKPLKEPKAAVSEVCRVVQ
jgi:hypothetical protein